jgi:hypothetical protein
MGAKLPRLKGANGCLESLQMLQWQGEEVLLSRATRTGGENSFPVFNLTRRRLEEIVQMKLPTNSLYKIKGGVVGVYDFDLFRRVGNYLRIMVPLEHRDEVTFGKVYSIALRSISEVELSQKQIDVLAKSRSVRYNSLMYKLSHVEMANAEPSKQVEERPPSNTEGGRGLAVGRERPFFVTTHLQAGRQPRVYFRIKNEEFQSGFQIEEGRSYRILGTIEGVGDFTKILRSLAARQDIPFYVPSEFKDVVRTEETYKVIIHSTEILPSKVETWEMGQSVELGNLIWRDVGDWIDTEGTVFEAGTLCIAQKERKVIQQFSAFLYANGIQSAMRLDKEHRRLLCIRHWNRISSSNNQGGGTLH